MDSISLDCQLVEKTSQKGNPYTAIEIKITDTYKKLVFLTQSEIELIKLFYNE